MRQGVEFVEWNIERIRETAIRVISYYGEGLGLAGFRSVKYAVQTLGPVLDQRTNEPAIFRGEGFELAYFGPSVSPIPLLQGEKVLWVPRQPKFTIGADLNQTRPRFWTLIERLNSQIGDEASKRHGLQVENHPFSLTFPKEEYADRIRIFEGGLLKA